LTGHWHWQFQWHVTDAGDKELGMVVVDDDEKSLIKLNRGVMGPFGI